MVKSFKKAIAILVSVLMIATSLPFTALTASAAESSQVYGYVTIDPIIYTHGTYSSNSAYDYMMKGSKIADGTVTGECKTSVSVTGKTISSVKALESGSTLEITNGILTGDLGSSYASQDDSTVTLQFNFTDGTYEAHKLPVKTNPVAMHSIGSCLVYTGTGYRRGALFTVVALGSYGSTSDYKVSNGNATEMNSQYIYDPYNTKNAWKESGCSPSNLKYLTNTDKKAGVFGNYAVGRKSGDITLIQDSGLARYYVDKSQGDSLGITHTAGSDEFTLQLFEGNFYTSDGNSHQFTSNDPKNTQKAFSNDVKTAGTMVVKEDGAKDTASNVNRTYNDNNKLYGYITLGGKITGTGEIQSIYSLEYRSYNGSNYGATRINTRTSVIVSDKTNARNAYNNYISKLKAGTLTPTCYTSDSWSSFNNALLTAEEYLNDNTDTSDVAAAKAALDDAYESLVAEHDFEVVTAEIKATCKTTGVSAVEKCKNCDAQQGGTTTQIDPTNHKNIVDIAAVAPTCAVNGTTAGKKCNDCGTVTVEPQVDPATGNHTPGTEVGNITKPATKTETGVMTYTTKCTVCEKVIDSLTRTEDIPVVADTAKTVTFVINGENVTREVNIGETPVAPTYAEKEADADYHYTYSWDKEFAEVTADDENITYTLIETAVAHNPVTDAAVPATHFAAGKTEGSHCSVCNYVIVAQQVEPKGEHTYVIDKDDADYVAADCNNGGTDVFVCSCGDSYKQPTQALGHTPKAAVKENLDKVDENGKLLNCEVAGKYNSVVYCEICEAKISSQEVIVDAIEHTYDVLTVDPTCTADGYKYEKCSACGYVNPTNIPVVPFVIDAEYPSAIKNAVTDNNSQEFVYSASDAKYIDHIVIKFNENCNIYYNGGTFGFGAVTGTLKVYDMGGNQVASFKQKEAANAEVTVPGTYARLVLSNANSNTYGYSIDSITAVPKLADGELVDDYKVLGHDMQDVEGSYVAPTCTTDGKNFDQKCSRCDYSTEGTVIEKSAHTPGATVQENVIAPTATQSGSHDDVVYCTECTNEISRTPVTDDPTGDFTAYNNAVASTQGLVESVYTADSWAALQAALAIDVSNAETQDQIDAATNAIVSAVNALVVADVYYTVTVVEEDENGATTVKTESVKEGSVYVATTVNELSVVKWTVETADTTKKIGTTAKEVSAIINGDTTFTVYLANDEVVTDTNIKVTYVGYSGNITSVEYYANEAAIALDCDSHQTSVAFYAFDGWSISKVSDNEYVYTATYAPATTGVTANVVSSDSAEILVNKAAQTNAYYDSVVYLSGDKDKVVKMVADGKVSYFKNVGYMHVPFANSVEISLVDSAPASSAITGQYKGVDETGATVAAFNANFYLPEDAELVECGAIMTVRDYVANDTETFQIGTAKVIKVASNSQSDVNEYTIAFHGNFTGFDNVYGRSYVTYTIGGAQYTEYSAVSTIEL